MRRQHIVINCRFLNPRKYPIFQIALGPTAKCCYGPQVKNHCTEVLEFSRNIRGLFQTRARSTMAAFWKRSPGSEQIGIHTEEPPSLRM